MLLRGSQMHIRALQGRMEPKVGRGKGGPGPEAWGQFSLSHRRPAQASNHPQHQPGLDHCKGVGGQVG